MSHILSPRQIASHMKEDLRRKKDCLKILEKPEYRKEKDKIVQLPNRNKMRIDELKLEIKDLSEVIASYEQQF